jgi:hypothetical protein
MAAILPGLTETTRLFAMLFGQDIVCNQRKESLSLKDCAIVAAYRDNEGAIKRILTCDIAFANSAGAALSAIPAGAANGATKAGEIPENIIGNLSEVMNVAVNLFTESFGGRLELEGVTLTRDLSAEQKSALAAKQRVKIDVAIPRYNPGRVDLIAV